MLLVIGDYSFSLIMAPVFDPRVCGLDILVTFGLYLFPLGEHFGAFKLFRYLGGTSEYFVFQFLFVLMFSV